MNENSRAGALRGGALAAVMALTAVVGLSGCGSGHDAAAVRSGALARAVNGTSTGAHGASSKTASPSMPAGTATPPSNPLAGKQTAVIRNGKRPHPTLSAAPEPFDKTISYRDGLTLQVTRIQQSVQTGYGPGVFHGSPITQISVKMTNRTHAAVNIEQVVVQLDYGSPARVAPPVDTDATSDFSGVLQPGHSQQAIYVFSVPTPSLGDVTMTVDTDSSHAAATFTGSVKN